MVQILPALVRKVPELRRTFFWNRYFISQTGFYFELAVLGLVTAGISGRWWVALAALPWLRHLWVNLLWPTTRILGLRQALARTALHIYGQVLETAVLLFASVRYRRLVL